MKFLTNSFKVIGVTIFGTILVALLFFFLITTPEERSDMRNNNKEPQTPQQQLIVKHIVEAKMHHKGNVEFNVRDSNVYFEGSAIVSCLQYIVDEKPHHSVLIKRKTKNVFKTTENAWNKYCAERDVDDFTRFARNNVPLESKH